MAFQLEEAYISLKTTGFAEFKKQTSAVSQNLSGIGKQIATIERSTAFSRQAGHARMLADAVSEIQSNFKRATAEADTFFKKSAASLSARPSTLARQRMNATRSGVIDADGTKRAFQGAFKNTGIEKLTTQIEMLSKHLSESVTHAKSLKDAFGGMSGGQGKSIQQITQRFKNYKDAVENAGTSTEGFWRDTTGKVRDSRGQYIKLNETLGGLSNSVGGLNNNFKNVRYQTLHAGYALKHLQQPIKGIVQGFTDIGTSVLGGLGPIPLATSAASLAIVGLTRVIGSAVSQSADLEKSLAEVATISSDVQGNISEFAARLGELSVATRTDVGLLSEGLYQAISSGITDVNEALGFLEVSANAARAGLTRVDVAVDGLSSVINAFGMEASDAGTIADKFFKTVEVGKLRFEDLARNIGKVAPVATTLGVSLDELLAAGAALTTGGNTLSVSFTALSGIMNTVLRPSKKAVELSKELGLEFSVAALKTKGLTGFLRDLEMQTGGNEEILGQLFGRVEGLKGIFALTGAQAESFRSNLELIGDAAGATDKAVEIMNNTLHGQIDLLKVQLANALRTVGNELLPSATSAMMAFNEALEDMDWEQFRNDVKATIDVIAGFIGFITKSQQALVDLAKTAAIFTPAGRIAAAPIRAAGQDSQPVGGNTSVGAFRALEAGPSSPVTPAAALTAATQTVLPTQLSRALGLSDADSNRLLGAVSPTNVLSPSLISGSQRGLQQTSRQARARQARVGLPPTVRTGANIAGTTDRPIPGVTGELINPRTAIVLKDAAMTFQEALAPLETFSATGDTAAALRTPETRAARLGQESLDAIAQRRYDEARRPSVLPGAAFGSVQEDFGVTPGQDIAPLFKMEAERLAGSFSLVGSAIEGAATGGLPGALIAVGAELVSMTEGFGRIQESWNGIVGQLVEAIDPLVSVIADALEPLFNALGDVLKELEPLFKLLGGVLKVTIVPIFIALGKVIEVLAKGIQGVANFITSAINFVIRLINKIPFVNIREIGEEREREGPRQLDRGRRTREGGDVQRFTPKGGLRDEDRLRQRIESGEVVGQAATARASSGGFRISAITGETRDILVDTLRPLNNLVQLVSIRDTLDRIEMHLRDAMPMAAGGYQPRQPNLANVPNVQNTPNPQLALGQNGGFGNAGGSIVIQGDLVVNVDQVSDLGPAELERSILQRLDLARRGGGEVFPNNRNRNNPFI